MKISYLILASFMVILLVFSITTFINYRQLDQVIDNSETFARSSIVVRYSNRFIRNYLTMVSGLRGYLLTNEKSLIQTYDSAVVENEQILNELVSLVPPGSDQKILLDEIRQLHSYWVSEFATPLLEAKRHALLSDSSKVAFEAFYQKMLSSGLEQDVQGSLQRKFADFSNNEYGFRDSQKEILASSVQRTKDLSFYLTCFSVIAGTLISVFIAYYISIRIVRMVKMANAIAQGNYAVHMNDRGKSELSQLAKALNNMAAILHSNISLLERQKSELDQFAHIVSHDLKAPLRGIDNVMTWIDEDHSFELPPKVREYHGLIRTRIVRAENLLQGILKYAHIGKEPRDLEYIDLNELLTEVKDYIPTRNGIVLKIMPNLPLLYSERLPLIQIFTNLIGNAIKYHDKDIGEISVFCQTKSDAHVFYVQDNGPGIDPAYHEKIFGIFQTLQPRDSFESTGVGLAIVKKILDDRGRSIHVRSTPGEGSVFYFSWPKQET